MHNSNSDRGEAWGGNFCHGIGKAVDWCMVRVATRKHIAREMEHVTAIMSLQRSIFRF